MLTVFIATRDGAATLPRVLASYTELDAPRGGWKLVVIDNGSVDQTATVLRSFAERLPLTVVAEPRPGKNRALNRGLAELDGDLAIFSDDDTLPERDWLVQLRTAADNHAGHDVFGGVIRAAWEDEPEPWVREWVRPAPVYGVTEVVRDDGPCEATHIWGTNMAVRATWFRKGYRFDEQVGPNGSTTYAMGSETEFTLRLALAEQIACWYCGAARVHHIIRPWQMTRTFVLKRAFHLGRCVRRESRQRAEAGQPHTPRNARRIGVALAKALVELAAARRAGDARRTFEARWQLNLWCGCLYEAARSGYRPHDPIRDAALPA